MSLNQYEWKMALLPHFYSFSKFSDGLDVPSILYIAQDGDVSDCNWNAYYRVNSSQPEQAPLYSAIMEKVRKSILQKDRVYIKDEKERARHAFSIAMKWISTDGENGKEGAAGGFWRLAFSVHHNATWKMFTSAIIDNVPYIDLPVETWEEAQSATIFESYNRVELFEKVIQPAMAEHQAKLNRGVHKGTYDDWCAIAPTEHLTHTYSLDAVDEKLSMVRQFVLLLQIWAWANPAKPEHYGDCVFNINNQHALKTLPAYQACFVLWYDILAQAFQDWFKQTLQSKTENLRGFYLESARSVVQSARRYSESMDRFVLYLERIDALLTKVVPREIPRVVENKFEFRKHNSTIYHSLSIELHAILAKDAQWFGYKLYYLNADAFRKLIADLGAEEINSLNADGYGILPMAMERAEYAPQFEALLDHPHIDVNRTDDRGETPLHFAVERALDVFKKPQFLSLLLQKCLHKLDLRKRGKWGNWNAIQLAHSRATENGQPTPVHPSQKVALQLFQKHVPDFLDYIDI